MALTNEEYLTLRQYCGLSQQDAAEFHGIKNDKTIRRWEKGQSDVSEVASEKLLWLNSQIDMMVKAFINAIDENTNFTFLTYSPEDIDMIPASHPIPPMAYNAAFRRLWLSLKEDNKPAHLVRMDRKKYIEWLAGRKDSLEYRIKWATEQIS